LKKAAGGELPVFDTLKSVDLSVANMGPHERRKTDPYDAAFFEHLGQVTSLESLNIIATKLDDDRIATLAGLTNLKSLRFTNNGKLSDAGLEKLAGLKNLEVFSFVGTGMQGHAFAKFEGWVRLARCSFRGSSIDDEGLRYLCEQFPNLESLGLAHAKFTDAGAVHLAKLGKLTSLELGSRNASPACLRNLSALPLEYVQLGDGLDSPDGIEQVKDIAPLRRLTLTHCEHLTDDGLRRAAGLRQLEQLEIGGLALPDERLSQLQALSFLKILRLINRPKGYSPETQAKIKLLLPKVDVIAMTEE
jgi:Leucine Rich Repeat (LRR) protein